MFGVFELSEADDQLDRPTQVTDLKIGVNFDPVKVTGSRRYQQKANEEFYADY